MYNGIGLYGLEGLGFIGFIGFTDGISVPDQYLFWDMVTAARNANPPVDAHDFAYIDDAAEHFQPLDRFVSVCDSRLGHSNSSR